MKSLEETLLEKALENCRLLGMKTNGQEIILSPESSPAQIAAFQLYVELLKINAAALAG